MRLSLLNLISTPAPVLNTLGLHLRVGLSSEDPMVVRHASEPYEAFLSIYSPEGILLSRDYLGEIRANRRRFFDISAVTRKLVPELDHLTVIHRVPSRLLSLAGSIEDEIEVSTEPDYSLFRSLIEYSYPGGGNGSVIYETPPRLNAGASSNTLTFTNQVVLSEFVNTYVILINYSVNPSYSHIADYHFGVHSLSGEQLVSSRVSIGPLAIKVLNMEQILPSHLIRKEEDPQDGLSTFTFVGCSDDAAVLVVVVNAAPVLGAVAVEHTHPPQTYLFPSDPKQQRKVKTDAQQIWKSIFSTGRSI
jgi:hypothetical protein